MRISDWSSDVCSSDLCTFAEFPDHFGFFLPLAGITTVKQVRESSFDIRATGRLNRLYVELLKNNPDWGTADRRPDMNHFMARLIFCFRSEEHTSELQSLMRISYAVFCLQKKKV